METDMQYITPYLPYDVRYAFRCAVDAKNDKEAIVISKIIEMSVGFL